MMVLGVILLMLCGDQQVMTARGSEGILNIKIDLGDREKDRVGSGLDETWLFGRAENSYLMITCLLSTIPDNLS